jgi:hypothetical protein
MWPSLPVANHIADVANWFFIGSLVVGVVSTILIVWMAGVKEAYWDLAREAAQLRIAELNNETARLRANDLLTADSLLANLHAGRANSLAVEANRSTTEALAVAQGSVKREDTSETTRGLIHRREGRALCRQKV